MLVLVGRCQWSSREGGGSREEVGREYREGVHIYKVYIYCKCIYTYAKNIWLTEGSNITSVTNSSDDWRIM